MKHIMLVITVGVIIVLFSVTLHAQSTSKIDIKAVVRGVDGVPIEGAIVRSSQDDVVATTNSTGEFSLQVSPDVTLSVKASGYDTKQVTATANLHNIDVAFREQPEPVKVAYRNADRSDLPPGVSYVNVTDLMKKNYITYGLEGMEVLVPGFNGNIWGMDSYLVLVDGVPRDVGSVMPTEIDQITFLKGVSAIVLYGSRAAKGVILITTKRGSDANQHISVRANAGVFVPKSYPKYLGSAEYMTLYNEARVNDGLDKLYSDETIYNYASGANPYRYPNVSYYSSDYLKKAYNRYDATVEISGGNSIAKYYTNIGYWTEGSLLNFGQAGNNKSNRFNVRGNIDLELSKNITCKVDAAAIYYNNFGINANYWGSAATLRPNRFAPLIPVSEVEESDVASWQLINNSNHLIGGKYLLGGTQLDQTNPFAAAYAGGYNKYTSRQFQFNTSVDADLKNALKGLSFNSAFGVDYATSYNQGYSNSYAVYDAAWNNYAGYDQITGLTKYGVDTNDGVQYIKDSWYRQTLSLSNHLKYINSIGGNKHNISAMLIAAGFQQAISSVYHKTSNVNLGIQIGYNFYNKYFADFSGAIVHSAKLPVANRNALSPTLSLGWRLSSEAFMSRITAVDNLKLTVSAGILNSDLNISGLGVSDYYLYQTMYTQAEGSWYSWRDGSLNKTTDSRRRENPNLNYPQRKEVSVGVEASFLDSLITFNGSVFANKTTGNVIQPSALYPSYFTTGYPVSSFIPYVNYNDDQRVGFDFSTNLNKRIANVDWSLGLTGTYYTTKATRRAELFTDSYQYRKGMPLDAIWGLQNLGFFKDDEDIKNSPTQAFGQVKPGDIKYKDQNGDGVINAQDEVYLGKGGWYGAPFTMGINFTAKWRNFTFFVLTIGRFGAYAMKNSSYFWVDGDDKYSAVVRDRWTEATKNSASYPRLTTSNSDNNFRSSDFWIYSTNRFDLSKVQISYTFPKSLIGNSIVRDLSVYVSGSNLLTISPNRGILEMNVGNAPQARFYNLGVKAQF